MRTRRDGRAVLRQSPQIAAVPGLAEQCAERVSVAANHPEDTCELTFHNEEPFIFDAWIVNDALVAGDLTSAFVARANGFLFFDWIAHGPDQALARGEATP